MVHGGSTLSQDQEALVLTSIMDSLNLSGYFKLTSKSRQ
uniref:Uncharacterized protein n=1 Tax=Anguilla anguilla TaxID=7936 RepID=A0A0E9WSQ3_ANGAN